MSEQRLLPSNMAGKYVPIPPSTPSQALNLVPGGSPPKQAPVDLPNPQIQPISTDQQPAQRFVGGSTAASASPPLIDVINSNGLDSIVNNMIQQEGGSPNGVMNNPGNIKFTGAPGQIDSGVKAVDGGTFASYESPAAGRQAVANIVLNAAQGKSSAYGPNPTLASFTATYQGRSNRIGMGNNLQQQAFDIGRQEQETYKDALSNIQKEMDQYKSVASRPASSDEMNAALDRQMQLSEKAADTFDKLVASPPQFTPKDIMQRMGSLGTVIAVLGGLKSRQPLTAALGAAGEAMKALNQNNYDNYKIAYDQWKAQSELVVQSLKAHSESINQILQNKRLSIEERTAELNALATATNNEFLKAKLATGAIEAPYKLQLDLENTRMAWQKLQNDSDRLNQQLQIGEARSSEILLDPAKTDASGNPTPYIFNKITKQSTTMSGEPYTPGGAMKVASPSQSAVTDQQIEPLAQAAAAYQAPPPSTWALRTPNGMRLYNRILAINPQYDAKKYTADVRALTNITGGPASNTVKSFSVAIDHLDVARNIFKGLHTGNYQIINRAKAALEAETGGPVVPTFEFAKEIVGDEVLKAVQGGIGALTDRENIKKSLSVASSPAQFESVALAAEQLMAGQLRGLKRQFSNVLTEEEFNAKLSDRAKEVLGEVQQPTVSSGPPKEAVDLLLKNPDKRDQFDSIFGPGAADKILGPR